MGIKVNRCDIVPPISSGGGGGAPVDAPYLTNGVDPNGDLTANVNVLALAAPQPFIATAPLVGDVGVPIIIAYNNGAGAANTGTGLGFRAQNDLDTTILLGSVLAQFSDATDGSEDSKLVANVYAAGAQVTALSIDNGGITLDGSGAKTITTSAGALTVSATGGTNAATVSAAGAASLTGGTAAAVTGATTATVQAGSGAATLRSTAAGAVVLGATTASLTATAGAVSVTGGTTAALTAGTNATVEGASVVVLRAAAAGNGVQVHAGGVPTWTFDDSASLNGRLVAEGSARPISNVSPSASTGDVVVHQQIFDAGIAAPTNGGATVAIVPGAEFIATATFTAPTGGAGTFLLQNNTGRTITLIGARALIPAAGANTLAITIASTLGATNLFTAAALAATGGAHLACATTYNLGLTGAQIANGAGITITAEGSAGTVAVILLLEFIVQ